MTYLTPLDDPNSYRNQWNDPAVEDRIAQGIETHRKSDAVVRVTDADGNPRAGVPVRARQRDSAFHFGANIFKLAGYESQELNQGYEEAFTGLFNAATVPFYWKTLEPEQGRLRFAADSAPIARRPPPDLVVDFCRERGLRMLGHTLVWKELAWQIPPWLPKDPAEITRLTEKRIREIAERYGDVIKRWDVLNEAASGPWVATHHHPMPENYEAHAFATAARYFPDDVRFDINDTTSYWHPHKRQYVDLIRRLRDGGAKLGGVGLQIHLFTDEDMARLALGERFAPRQLFETLDLYGQFGLPIHVSEITLTSPDNSPEGLELQADAARSFYRLWFSHPSVDSITWWNVPDGGAAPGEDRVFSGLLFADMSPKPSCHALRKLLLEEWRTTAEGVTGADGCFRFRGFHGRYAVEAAGCQETLVLAPRGEAAHFEIRA